VSQNRGTFYLQLIFFYKIKSKNKKNTSGIDRFIDIYENILPINGNSLCLNQL